MPLVPLGPWPLGQDTVQDETSSVFQVSLEGQEPSRLTAAVNVDLDDDGWPQRRSGTSGRVSATGALTAISFAGNLYLHAEESLLTVDTDTWLTSTTVTGLSASIPVKSVTLGGSLWWTDGTTCGVILDDGTASNWGMAVPPAPTLTAVTGDLPAGVYQVACTYLDAKGVESGAGQASSITLDGNQDIRVTLTPNDSNAIQVVVYCSGPDTNKTLFRQGQVAVNLLPVTVTDVTVTRYPLHTQFMRGPVPGAGIASFHNILFTWSGRWLYPSHGLSPHLFRVGHEAVQMPATIQAVAGIESGIWVATVSGLFWLAGPNLAGLNVVRLDDRPYATGSLVVVGDKISALNLTGPVALFVCDEGLMAGLPSGETRLLTDGRLAITDVASQHASIVYRELSGFDQILFSLE